MIPTVVSFEGIDTCGKGTQIGHLMHILTARNIKAVVKREPGGTPYGEAIRALLKHPDLALPALEKAMSGHGDMLISATDTGVDLSRTAECEVFLFLASRAEFCAKVIEAELRNGCHVIADRLYDSTVAYQGGGRFHSDLHMLEFISRANAVAMRGIKPIKTIFLDISVETMRRRLDFEHPDKVAVFEKEDREFFQRTIDAYHWIAKREPERVIIVDAERSVPVVFEEVLGHLRPILGIN